MTKNIQKYFSYKFAFERIDAAIAAGFYLEAITIEESILTDRLFRFCHDHGLSKTAYQATLGDITTKIRKIDPANFSNFPIDFLEELDNFRIGRNACLHQIAKSDPGTPTMDYSEFMSRAKSLAISGKQLVKRVSNWAAKYKKTLSMNTGE
jgi:hypothetical protein